MLSSNEEERIEERMTIVIHEATPDDSEAMREVQRCTWIATYPREGYGITKEDLVSQSA